jgi:hypothetical protein
MQADAQILINKPSRGTTAIDTLPLRLGSQHPSAVGSSLVVVSAFGAATAATYALSGLINWSLAGLFVLGGSIGGTAGVRLGRILAIRKGALTDVFAGMVITVGLCCGHCSGGETMPELAQVLVVEDEYLPQAGVEKALTDGGFAT